METITFLMIFSAYIIITVDYSKSFKLKNEVLTIVEKNKGMTVYNGVETTSTIKPSQTVITKLGAIKTINAFLAASSYSAKGPCNRPKGTNALYGVKELKYGKNDAWSQIGEVAVDGRQYYYCFAKYPTGRADKEAYDKGLNIMEMTCGEAIRAFINIHQNEMVKFYKKLGLEYNSETT